MKGMGTDWGWFENKVWQFPPGGKSQACWGSLMRFFQMAGLKPNEGNEKRYIYFNHYDCDETRKYRELLLDTLNEITVCKITKANKEERVKFLLLGTYDQSLILLNFARNLWYEPASHKGYTKLFFEALTTSQQEDPLSRLTEANIKANVTNTQAAAGHCNIHPNCKIKKVSQLLAYRGTTTRAFLTQP